MTIRFTFNVRNLHIAKTKVKNIISNFRYKSFLILLCISLVAVGISCSNTGHQRQISKEKLNKKRQKFLKAFPPEKGAFELQEQFYFPNEELEQDGIFLNNPLYLCSDKYQNIYVSDKENNCILKFNKEGNFLEKIGGSGQAPGSFLLPRYLDTDRNDNLYIYDTGNSRIQLFNTRNEYLNNFKIFKSYSKMAVGNQGFIYLSPLSQALDEPLIEVLNNDGSLMNSFGKRIKFKYNCRWHQSLLISINKKGEVFAAWSHFPIIRRYSSQGKLISEYNIEYRLLKRLSKPNHKAKQIRGKIKMNDVICSIRAKNNKFYLLVRYPRLEILEISLSGKIVNIYWKESPIIFYSTDFIVHEYAEKNLKIFYVLSSFPKPQIKVFSRKGISVKEILNYK